MYGRAQYWAPCARISSVNAWESDVHYGLTKWLAIHAGFTAQQASWIADGYQGIDKSWITDPLFTTIVACVQRDDTASRRMHDDHFPGQNSAPNAPDIRSVEAGYVQQAGNKRAAPRIINYADEARFKQLGEYLRSFQDSWSHQGRPDFPQPPCNPKLGWGPLSCAGAGPAISRT
jgi:hypothetical protein